MKNFRNGINSVLFNDDKTPPYPADPLIFAGDGMYIDRVGDDADLDKIQTEVATMGSNYDLQTLTSLGVTVNN